MIVRSHLNLARCTCICEFNFLHSRPSLPSPVLKLVRQGFLWSQWPCVFTGCSRTPLLCGLLMLRMSNTAVSKATVNHFNTFVCAWNHGVCQLIKHVLTATWNCNPLPYQPFILIRRWPCRRGISSNCELRKRVWWTGKRQGFKRKQTC